MDLGSTNDKTQKTNHMIDDLLYKIVQYLASELKVNLRYLLRASSSRRLSVWNSCWSCVEPATEEL